MRTAPTAPAALFTELVAPWRRLHGPLPATLCGMIGSTLGWVDAGYLPCPADAAAIVAGARRFVADGVAVAILPGLSCAANVLDAPDVMRGEETQIVGAMVLEPYLSTGRHLMVLPGTHTKWALLEDGRVMTFLTAFTGELFAVLRDHSTLGRGGDTASDSAAVGFAAGLRRQAEWPQAPLSHLVFETRSRQVLGGMARAEALAFLSGLLIGADVAAGLRCFASDTMMLIGEPALTGLYEQALAAHGVAARGLDGAACECQALRVLQASTAKPF